LDVLALDGGQDIAGRDPESLEPSRVQPHPHAVRASAEDSHLADSREPGQRVLQTDERIIRKEDLLEPVVVGVEAGDEQKVWRDLSDRDALRLSAAWKLGHRAVGGVLYQGQRRVQISPNVEGDRQGI